MDAQIQLNQHDNEAQRSPVMNSDPVNTILLTSNTVPLSTVPLPSIWENFDVQKLSNVGFNFDFVPPPACEGEKVGHIDFYGIKTEIEYWNKAIVCYVLGDDHPASVFFCFIQ